MEAPSLQLTSLDKALFRVLWNTPDTLGLWREDVARTLDKPRTTVWDCWERWRQRGCMSKYLVPVGGRGRPNVYFKLTSKGREFYLKLREEGYL